MMTGTENFVAYRMLKKSIEQTSITYGYRPLHYNIKASNNVKKDAKAVYRESMTVNNTVLDELNKSNHNESDLVNHVLAEHALNDLVHLYDKINFMVCMLEKHNNVTIYVPDNAPLTMDGIEILVSGSCITVEVYYKTSK